MAERFNNEHLQSGLRRSSSRIPYGYWNPLVSPQPGSTSVGNLQGQKGILGGPPSRGIEIIPRETYDVQGIIDNLPRGISQLSLGNVQDYSENVNHEGLMQIHNMSNIQQDQEFFTQNDNFHSLTQSQAIGNPEYPGSTHGKELLHDYKPSMMTSKQSYTAQANEIQLQNLYLSYSPQQQVLSPTNVQTGIEIPRPIHSDTLGSYEMTPYEKSSLHDFELQDQPWSRVVGGPIKDNWFDLYHLVNVKNKAKPELKYLFKGIDLTKLGVDVTSKKDFIYNEFASPWSDEPAKEEHVYSIPDCYAANQFPPLKQCHFTRFSELALMYIFYSMPKDEAQLYAANELCNKGWLYHKELQMWLQRVPSEEPLIKTSMYERGDYLCFDPEKWAKILKENFVLHYEMVEKRPVLPQQ